MTSTTPTKPGGRAAALAAAAAVAVVLLAQPQPASADRDAAILALAHAANPLGRYGEEISVNSRWDHYGTAAKAVRECFDGLEAALAAGIKPREEFVLPEGVGARLPHTRMIEGARMQDRRHATNLTLIRGHCIQARARVQLIRTYLAVREAHAQLVRLDRIADAPHLQEGVRRFQLAAVAQRVCAREVERARRMKNPPTIKFDRPDVTLGAANKEVCGALDERLATSAAALRAKAELGPYHAVLEGDKRKVFDEHLLFGAQIFGDNKFPLKEPEDFAYVSTWHLLLPDAGELNEPRWLVRSFTFEGATLASTKEQGGEGDPPAEAFR
jgi:hypothetical protein